MAETPNLDDAIRENATGPKRVSGDSGSVEQHSLREQIDAAQHLSNKEAAKKPHRGLRFTKLILPGPTG